MKKISFFFGAALMLSCAFTLSSCNGVADNPAGSGLTDPPTVEVDVDVFKAEFTYDFAAVAAAGQNPDNLNGSAAKGQAFYGWEKADKTDSKRQDYKGYTWAEGSVLPEVCHVWRRSDRINNNIVEGGLKCPNNREMAIDGLEEGSVVVITYDATEAAEDSQNMVWAIGDGTSSEGQGVRATATIDGVEAITGETVIPSGAQIVVNTVTPAENGTGYIVFQVKKGMVISKIEIGKIVVEKQTIIL